MDEQSYIFCSLIKHFLQCEKYISEHAKAYLCKQKR